VPPFPAEALVLARRTPAGYEPAGSVVEAVVDVPVWTMDAVPAPEKGPATAVTVDGVIYILYERGTMWKRDPAQGEPGWTPCDPYEAIRPGCSVVAAGGRIYALGGLDVRGRPSARVDCYDPERDRWSDQPRSMHAARAHFAAAGGDRGIVVLGGRRRTWFGWRYASKNAEAFDLETGRWRRLSPMPFRRYASAAVWIGGNVYLICGCIANVFGRGRGTPSSRVDRLHVATQGWAESVPLAQPRAGARAVPASATEIVVAGGVEDHDGRRGAERIRLAHDDVRPLWMAHRTRFGLAFAGGVLYAFAGRTGEDAGENDADDVERATFVDRIGVYRRSKT
jgi:hypothetical protein